MAPFTDRHFSSLPGSDASPYLTNRNNIDNERVERNEAGVFILYVCLVCTEQGCTFVRIMCIHTHAQNFRENKAS